MVRRIFIFTTIKNGSSMPRPVKKTIKLENTVTTGNISRGIENWFNKDELLKTEFADSLTDDEKKNHGNIPLRTKNVKLYLLVLKIFVKTKLITKASNSGLIIDHPKPNLEPIYLFLRSFMTKLLKISLLIYISFSLDIINIISLTHPFVKRL